MDSKAQAAGKELARRLLVWGREDLDLYLQEPLTPSFVGAIVKMTLPVDDCKIREAIQNYNELLQGPTPPDLGIACYQSYLFRPDAMLVASEHEKTARWSKLAAEEKQRADFGEAQRALTDLYRSVHRDNWSDLFETVDGYLKSLPAEKKIVLLDEDGVSRAPAAMLGLLVRAMGGGTSLDEALGFLALMRPQARLEPALVQRELHVLWGAENAERCVQTLNIWRACMEYRQLRAEYGRVADIPANPTLATVLPEWLLEVSENPDLSAMQRKKPVLATPRQRASLLSGIYGDHCRRFGLEPLDTDNQDWLERLMHKTQKEWIRRHPEQLRRATP